MENYNIEEIIKFYQKCSEYEKVTNMHYEISNTENITKFKFISHGEIKFNKTGFTFQINRQMKNFLVEKNGISPIHWIKNKKILQEEEKYILKEINELLDLSGLPMDSEERKIDFFDKKIEYKLLVDKNHLLLSPIYLKLFSEEENKTIFLPLVLINITHLKNRILTHDYSTRPFFININYSDPIFYNNFLFSTIFKENSSNLGKTLSELSNSIEFKQNSSNNILKESYKKIIALKKENDLSISFPNIDKSDPLMLFFNFEELFEIKNNFEQALANKNELLNKYLFSESGNQIDNFNNKWFGSDTRDFPLGVGQSMAIQAQEKNQKLISIKGPPGTGKTTLIKSLIANEVTKRALNSMFGNEDYSNLILITSTSNKAIENIAFDLEKDYNPGYCYIGGNSTNKKNSIPKVDLTIEYIRSLDYDEDDLFLIKEEIKKILTQIEEVEKVEDFRKNLYKESHDLFKLSRMYLNYKISKNKIRIIRNLNVLKYNNFSSIDNPEQFLKDISLIYPVVTSTIASIENMFKGLNKYVIYNSIYIDEAGMIKPQDLIYPLTKASKAVIIGDPTQLKPISKIHNLFEDFIKNKLNKFGLSFFNLYSPTMNSAFTCVRNGNQNSTNHIYLEEHRRCQPEIANLFKLIGNYTKMNISTELKEPLPQFPSKLVFINTNNISNSKNESLEEITIIDSILNKFSIEDQINNISIITPYLKQEDLILKEFEERVNHSVNEKKIGTIHKFQGTEYEIVIFSSTINKNSSLSFLNKDNSLLNVAISRAKRLFIFIGNFEKLISEEGSGKELALYMEKEGFFINNFDIINKNN